MIQSRRASSWQSYWEMRGGGQREREKKEDLLRRRGATSVQEGGASKIFLPSFLFLRLEKHKTHAHTYKMDWWFDSMISSYSFDSLLLLLPLLLLLFLFHDGWSSRHLCSVSYFAGNFISNNFWNIFVVVVGLVCLSVAQLLISSRRTYTLYTVKSCLHLLFCRAAFLSCAVSYGYGWGGKKFLWYWATINQ